jgi:hypothetical protein
MTGAILEHTPRKSLKHLADETEVSECSARTATQLLKLTPYKTTVIHACLSVVEGEIDPQLKFFSDAAWFHVQVYINTQNNRYWSSQNSHLTHEVLLHPVKVGVCCAVSARRIVAPLFFLNETIKCVRYEQVILGHFCPELTEEGRLCLVSARLSYCPHCTYIYAGFVRCLWGQNYHQ